MRINRFEFSLDINRPAPILIRRIVDGDTSNEFWITVKNNGVEISFDANLDKVVAVFRRSDGTVYTQDEDSGVTVFAGSGDVRIYVRSSSFRTGANTVELQIYSRENTSETEYSGLITTQQAQFTARAATLVGEGETAPSQLPMLEQIISDAEDATEAANDAAEALNALLDNIDDEPTEGSNNLVKSGGVHDAIERSGKVYIVPYTGSTWVDNVCEITPTDSYETLSAMVGNAVLVINTPNNGATLYQVTDDGREIYFRSPDYDVYGIKYHYEAVIDEYHEAFIRRVYDKSPFQLTVSEIVWDNNNELTSVTFNQTASVILDAIGKRPIECDIPCEHDAGGGLIVTDHYYVREISWVAPNAYMKEVVLLSYDPFTGNFCEITLQVNSSSVSANGSFGTLNV